MSEIERPGASSPATYVATFDRVGRRRDVEPLTVHCSVATDVDGRAPDELLDALTRYVSRFLGSREIEVMATVAGDEGGGPRGLINVGGFRNAGSFTLSLLEAGSA